MGAGLLMRGDDTNRGIIHEKDGYSIAMRNKEINHGRLAMIALAGLWFVEFSFGLSPAEQLKVMGKSGLSLLFPLLFFVWYQPDEASRERLKSDAADETPASAAASTS